MYKKYLQNIRRRARLSSADLHEENAYLSALVDPIYYSGLTKIAFPTRDDASRHFLEKGIDQGLAPSNFFEPPDNLRGKKLREYFLNARVDGPSSGWFDANFYRSENPDVNRSVLAPFEHFVRWGIDENRNPNAVFDSTWFNLNYAREPEEFGMTPFRRFTMFGDKRAQAPARWLLPLFNHTSSNSGTVLDRLGKIARVTKPWIEKIGFESLQFLAGLFYSHSYDGGGALSADIDGVERFAHFLTSGLERGLDPGPLFATSLYMGSRGVPLKRGDALVDFLQNGYKYNAPTRLYDDVAYRSVNADLRDPNYWTFRHFVMHGIYEGRSAGHPRAYIANLSGDGAGRSLDNWHRFWAPHSLKKSYSRFPRLVADSERRMRELMASPVFGKSVALATALEPSLGNIQDCALVLPPFYDMREAARVELNKRFRSLSYDVIICAPFLKTGGADLVACLLADALSMDSQRRVLLLRTDQDYFERPDWVPRNVDCVDISDVIKMLPNAQAEEYFYSLLLGLSAKSVFNVNSNLCWRTFARYGSRLSRLTDLYAYLFCWDRDINGHLVGYPSDFYVSTAPHLRAVLTDTVYLRDQLIKLHKPPENLARRLVPLFSPVSGTIQEQGSLAEVSATKSRARPRILWAGRLDRQKRFDLVVDIARSMPEVEFLCWGTEGIDAIPAVRDLPSNLILQSTFKRYEDLPLDDADVWLFTSAWEGMPTLIIELAVRGVPIVASAVGGVPELIDETTGYPVHENATVEAYVEVLNNVIMNPSGRVAKAKMLQIKAKERHSKTAYVERLEQIVSGEL